MQKLRTQVKTFNIPYLELPETTPAETALDVFIQMNTSATPLSTYDIVVAQVEAGTGRSLHDLMAELRETVPQFDAYSGQPEDVMLSSASLLQGRDTRKTNALESGFPDRLVDDWPRLLDGVRRAVSFLEDERVFDAKRLPTDVAMAPLVALWAVAPEGLDAEGEARTLLRRFLWRAFFTERYERASNSRVLADFRSLRELVQGRDAPMPDLFADDLLPEKEMFLEAGWPTRKDRLARVLLALAIRNGGIDFADGSRATRDTLQRREYHHLFPVAYLRSQGVAESDAFTSLNCALVTWRTNRTIAAKSPERYLAERMEASSLGEPEIKRRLAAHLIPYEPIVSADYRAFLEARADLMIGPMRQLCDGNALA